MRKRWIVGVVVVSMFISACASTSALRSRNNEKRRVKDEANEFYNALRDKNPEKMWQLLSPFVKKENPKEGYVADVEGILKAVTDLDYSNLTVVYMSKKLAVTQVYIQFRFHEEDKVSNIDECARAIWLRFPEGWRVQEYGLSCSYMYMPDKKRIKFLTKNVPDL